MRKVCFIILLLMVFRLPAQNLDSSDVLPFVLQLDRIHLPFTDSIGIPHSSLSSYPLVMVQNSPKAMTYEVVPFASSEAMVWDGLAHQSSVGAHLVFARHSFSAAVFPECNVADYPGFIGEKFDSMNVLPYHGKKLFSSGKTVGGISVPVYLKYRISPLFDIEGGNGSIFLGDGYRSMLLSDQSAEFPYLRLVAHLSPIKYMHQLSRWRQQTATGSHETKFAATHYLSWMITKNLDVSVFESVIWKSEDSVRRRGFEWLYLNPVLFFRPAEYALGSPDNNLIGGNISWNVFSNTKVYGQFVLDEFFISEIKNWLKHVIHPDDTTIPYGAWVNKQGFQIGVKSINAFGIQGLCMLGEFNFMRPYTGSHRDPVLSNTHMNQPVAHPYGANFYELVLRSQFNALKWSAHLNATYYITGLDSTGTHFGQDLLQSTFDGYIGGNIPVSYYGNTVGQGVRHQVLQIIPEFRRNFWLGQMRLLWRIGLLYRYDGMQTLSRSEKYIFTGLYLNVYPTDWNQR